MSSSVLDRSECFTLHTLVYLFIPTQIRLLRDAFRHAAITVRRLHSRESCILAHFVADMLFCRLYSVGALLNNYMTTVIICFSLQYVSCRGPLEQQCIRYFTSNVFGSGSIGSDSSDWFFLSVHDQSSLTQHSFSRRKCQNNGWW